MFPQQQHPHYAQIESDTHHASPTHATQAVPKWAQDLSAAMDDIKAWQTKKDEVLAKLDMKMDEVQARQSQVVQMIEEVKSGEEMIVKQVQDNLAYRMKEVRPFTQFMEKSIRQIDEEVKILDQDMAIEEVASDLIMTENWLKELQSKKLVHFNEVLHSLTSLGETTTVQAINEAFKHLRVILPEGTLMVDSFIEKLINPKTYFLDECFTVYKTPNSRIDLSVKSVNFPITHVHLKVLPYPNL